MPGFENKAYESAEAENGFTPGTLEQIQLSVFQNSEPDGATIVPAGEPDGIPIQRGAVDLWIKTIKRKFWTQLAMSIVRNFFCYGALVCIFIFIVDGANAHNWSAAQIVPTTFILCLGVVAIIFQVLRIVRDYRFVRPSIVARMLQHGMSKSDFLQRLQVLQLAPPEVTLQVTLKSGAISFEDPNHWTRTSRKTGKIMEYRAWADQSMNTREIQWPKSSASWIILAKDYRCINKETEISIAKEATEFKCETGFEAYSYYMDCKYILGLRDGDQSFLDAEPLLIYENERPFFFNMLLFRILLFLCLDSVYKIIFAGLAVKLEDYYVVKFIER